MAYDKAKFDKLISLEVPYKIALALSDSTNPLAVAGKGVAVADIPTPGSATAATTATKVNELLASLRAAGIIS